MNNRRKLAYQGRELERLVDENRDLKAEIRALEKENSYKDKMLASAEEGFKKLEEAYNTYLFNYSEQVEKLAEAQMIHDDASLEIKEMMRKYKKEIEALIAEIKIHTRKVV